MNNPKLVFGCLWIFQHIYMVYLLTMMVIWLIIQVHALINFFFSFFI